MKQSHSHFYLWLKMNNEIVTWLHFPTEYFIRLDTIRVRYTLKTSERNVK